LVIDRPCAARNNDVFGMRHFSAREDCNSWAISIAK
jgi:hypothetical protein